MVVPSAPGDRAAVATTEVFCGLGEGALDDVMAASTARTLARGTHLFDQEEPASAFFVLLSGRVKVSQLTPEGKEVVVRFLGPGDVAGCAAVLGDSVYPATAEVIEDVRALAFDGRATTALMERHPRIATNAMRVLGARLREAQARCRELATERVERRIARAVVRLARQAGRRVEAGVTIDLPLSRQDLAEMSGTTLFTVSRTMSEWERRGIVALGREKVVVTDPRALVGIAEEP